MTIFQLRWCYYGVIEHSSCQIRKGQKAVVHDGSSLTRYRRRRALVSDIVAAEQEVTIETSNVRTQSAQPHIML